MKKTTVARLGMGIYGMLMTFTFWINRHKTANSVTRLAKEIGVELQPAPTSIRNRKDFLAAAPLWYDAIYQRLGEPDAPVWAQDIFMISSTLSSLAAENTTFSRITMFRKHYDGTEVAEIIEKVVCLCIEVKIPSERINELIMIKNVFLNARFNAHANTATACILGWCTDTFAQMAKEDDPNRH